MEIKKKSTILFLGDCITGWNRNMNDPDDLGNGYVARISDAIKNYRIKVINRGTDEHRTIDLLNEYEENILNVKPDVITIFIGMNDVWHHFAKGVETTNEEFEYNFKTVLEKIKNDLDVPVIIIEPFIIDITPELTIMRSELWQKVDIIRTWVQEKSAR